MDFTWTMNENEWKRLKDVQKSKKYDSNDCFGSCYVGGICCDFQHTMDPGDWYAFVNLFYVEDNTTNTRQIPAITPVFEIGRASCRERV